MKYEDDDDGNVQRDVVELKLGNMLQTDTRGALELLIGYGVHMTAM